MRERWALIWSGVDRTFIKIFDSQSCTSITLFIAQPQERHTWPLPIFQELNHRRAL